MIEVSCDKIIVGERFRKNLGDLRSLMDSMTTVGLLHPIVVDPQYRLICGARRLEAAKCLGWKVIPVTVFDSDRPITAQRDENEERLKFTVSEALAIKNHVLLEEQDKAKARRREGGRRGALARHHKIKMAPMPGCEPSSRAAARGTGYSFSTLDRAEKVFDAAKKDPKRFGPVADEMERTGNVKGAFKKIIIPKDLQPSMPKALEAMKFGWLQLDAPTRKKFLAWTRTKEGRSFD